MTHLLVIAIAALIYSIGVMSARYVVPAAEVAGTYIVAAVATVESYIVIGYRMHATAINAAVAAGRKKTESVTDRVVYALTCDLPDTSIYSLSVTTDSTEYTAGEYLIRDNGSWRSVYLTVHARALMGPSADVIALCPARVTDATGTTHVWHVSIA